MLRALQKLTEKDGVPPGYGTLAAHLGITRTAAKMRLLRLKERGLIEERPVVIPGPWKITRKGKEWL